MLSAPCDKRSDFMDHVLTVGGSVFSHVMAKYLKLAAAVQAASITPAVLLWGLVEYPVGKPL